MKPHGVMHNVDCPAHITITGFRGTHSVKRVSYIKYGLSHNYSGPSQVTYNPEGEATSVYYSMNHNRINHSKYLKDEYNPTIEEMFLMKLGEA